MKNKMKINFGLGIIFILFLISIGGANAISASLTAPTTNENITISPYTLSATVIPSAGGAIYNVTFRYSSDGSAYTNIATVQNTSTNQTVFTSPWDWSAMPNGAYYINMSGYDYNTTSGVFLDSATSQSSAVGLDNTPPTISTPTYPDSVLATAIQSISVKATDIGFPDGVSSMVLEVLNNGMIKTQNYTMTKAGVDNFTVSLPAGKGLMKFKLFATDNHGWTTQTSLYTYETYLNGRRGGNHYEPLHVTPQAVRGTPLGNLIKELFTWLKGLF